MAAGTGCSNGAAEDGGGSAWVGGHPEAGGAGAPGALHEGGRDTVLVSGQVVDVANQYGPYAGAVGCVLDSDPARCATSADDGWLDLELPANARTGITFEDPDLVPMLTPITTAADDIAMADREGWANGYVGAALPAALHDSLGTLIGTSLDATKGHADLIVTNLNGGTVTVEGGSAEASWHIVDGGLPFAADGGAAPTGDQVLLGFANVDPGMITFRAEKDGAPCAWDPLLWAGDEPGTVTVPVRAGWWTRLLEVRCDRNGDEDASTRP